MKNTRNKPFGKHNDVYLYCTQEEYPIIKDMSIVERCKYLNENQLKNDENNIDTQLQSLERLEKIEEIMNFYKNNA